MQEFAQAYRAYSDKEIIRLHGDAASLTDEARSALFSDLQRRGLREEEVLRMQQQQADHIAELDKENRQETKDKLLVGLMSILGGRLGRAAARSIVQQNQPVRQQGSALEKDAKS